MKLYYISPRDVRKNRADPVHMMKSCSAFAALGADVTLVAPRYFEDDWKMSKGGIWGLYGLEETFRVIELPTYLREGHPAWLVRLQKLFWFSLFFTYLAIKASVKRERPVIYSKCYVSFFPAILLRKLTGIPWKIFLEKPDFDASNRFHRYICRNVDGIVAINRFVARWIVDGYGVPGERVDVLRHYTYIAEFEKYRVTKAEARARTGLPEDAYIVMYTGKLYPGQLESRYIMEAAALCPDKLFVLVGAREHVIESFESFLNERGIRNVVLRGFQPLENLYYYVQSADLLVSYYENEPFSAYQRVPAKLSNYACAGRPLILADLPSLRDQLTDDEVYFVKPDSPEALARTIGRVATNREEAEAKAKRLHEFALSHDQETTMRKILEFIERTGGR